LRLFISVILWLLAYILVWFGYGNLSAQAGTAKTPKEKSLVYAAGPSNHGVLTVDSALDRIEKELAQQQITQAAISELAQIINHDPKNCRAHIVMGNCCDYLGLPEQAVQQYRLAIRYGPDQPEACLHLIKALIETGQWAAASNLLKQAQQRFPNDPQILLWTGNASLREGKYRQAEDLYQLAMQVAKKPVLGLPTALASLRLRERNYAAAYRLADKDLAIDRNFPPANEMSGVALMKTGQFERAMPRLKIAFEHSSPSFTLAFDYTQSLIWCGQYNDALIAGLCSLAIASSDQYRAMVRKAINEISTHLDKQAVEKAVQTLSHYPLVKNSAVAHAQMAKICLDKGLTNLAASESFIAVKLAPQSAQAKYELALILECYQHNYLTALKYLRQAHALAPNDNEINQHLMRLEDRLTSSKTDWSWQFKNWLSGR
jgi:tetratricopeptide (TPR) repeat protein